MCHGMYVVKFKSLKETTRTPFIILKAKLIIFKLKHTYMIDNTVCTIFLNKTCFQKNIFFIL